LVVPTFFQKTVSGKIVAELESNNSLVLKDLETLKKALKLD